MNDGKILNDNEENIIPITHESCVLDANGNSITNTIGDVSLLKTTNDNLVGAINELYDNALKDQIVEILASSGVESSANEPWPALIEKLRSNTGGSGSFDVISATSLPATGTDGQICVITPTIVNDYIITSCAKNTIESEITNKIALYTGTEPPNYICGDCMFSFYKAMYNDKTYASYVWDNGEWNKLTEPIMAYLENGVQPSSGVTESGGLYPSGGNQMIKHTEGAGYKSTTYGQYIHVFSTFSRAIDLSKYNTIEFKACINRTGSGTFDIFTANGPVASYNGSSYSGWIDLTSAATNNVSALTYSTITVDISSWSGTKYLGVQYRQPANDYFIMSDFYIY
jgi:hypothetical protein